MIAVRQRPTHLGPFAFTLDQPSDTEALLRIKEAFTAPLQKILIHTPWFVGLRSVTADLQTI